MLFDTHAHFDAEQFNDDREAVLASLPESGVHLVVNPGCDLASSAKAIELAEKFDHVYAAVGIHPEDCAGCTYEDIEKLEALAKMPKVVAIGEIGLDYYWEENPPKEFQSDVFRWQLELADKLNLPVIVHDRDAHNDCLTIVKEYPNVRGVFHCYAGAVDMAKELIKMGWYLGFNGACTFKNARKAPEVIRWAPLDRIVIETDSPYLTPVPYRGKRNDSRYVHLVAEKIAEYKQITPQEVEQATWENGKTLYRI